MIIDPERLVKIGKEVVEGITEKKFPGEVKVILGSTSYAHTKAGGGDGRTEISLGHIKRGLQEVIRVGAHELGHHHLNHGGGEDPRQEKEANKFADELVVSRIEQTFFSDLEPVGTLRFEVAKRFGGLRPLSQEQIAERYEETLTTLGGDRIDLSVTKEAASILAEEDLRTGVTRATIDEGTLQPHHIRMVEEHEELYRIYRQSLMNHRRSRP